VNALGFSLITKLTNFHFFDWMFVGTCIGKIVCFPLDTILRNY